MLVRPLCVWVPLLEVARKLLAVAREVGRHIDIGAGTVTGDHLAEIGLVLEVDVGNQLDLLRHLEDDLRGLLDLDDLIVRDDGLLLEIADWFARDGEADVEFTRAEVLLDGDAVADSVVGEGDELPDRHRRLDLLGRRGDLEEEIAVAIQPPACLRR